MQINNYMPETRNIVVQYATMLDEICSYSLSQLLQIDQDNSVSFGYKGQALSFNSKITLLYDIAGTDAILKSKFKVFAEIRNKFAHVFSVSSFDALRKLDKDQERNCNKILEWYTLDLKEYPDQEFRHIISYILLFKELEDYTLQIVAKDQERRGYEAGKFNSLQIFQEVVSKELLKLPEGLEIYKKYFKAME